MTARADIDSPVVAELAAIFGHHVKNHVILVDDARMFEGRDGYPTILELRRSVPEHYSVWVQDDIVSITPKAG